VQGLNEMPLTLDVILNDRPAEVIARGRRNFVATDEAVRIMQEWCGEHGFIKNAKVKQILQAEVNRINRITTTQGEQ
jgi:hypothetical protein